jgi:ABC-type polysaccharide/polyol phosphate export permease
MTDTDPELERARTHVKQVRDFLYHLMTFVFVCGLLVIIDRGGGANDGVFGLDWAFWVILTWGLGLVGHAISVFFGDYRAEKLSNRANR